MVMSLSCWSCCASSALSSARSNPPLRCLASAATWDPRRRPATTTSSSCSWRRARWPRGYSLHHYQEGGGGGGVGGLNSEMMGPSSRASYCSQVTHQEEGDAAAAAAAAARLGSLSVVAVGAGKVFDAGSVRASVAECSTHVSDRKRKGAPSLEKDSESDKASMLDNAIEYMKSLQLQEQGQTLGEPGTSKELIILKGLQADAQTALMDSGLKSLSQGAACS